MSSKKGLCLIVLVFVFCCASYSQVLPNPGFKTAYSFDRDKIGDQKFIAKAIETYREFHEASAIEKELLKVSTFNNQIEKQLDLGSEKLKALQNEWAKLAQISDLDEIRIGIRKAVESQKQFQGAFYTSLRNQVSASGLYLIVLKPGTNDFLQMTPGALSSAAQNVLAPRAIKDLRDVFVSLLTTVIDQQGVQSTIVNSLSGTMTVIHNAFERRRLKTGDYVVLMHVKVSPLTQEKVSGSAQVYGGEKSLVNCENADDLTALLEKIKLTRDDSLELRKAIKDFSTEVNDANDHTRNQVSGFWDELKQKEANLKFQIDEMRQKEVKKNTSLKELTSKYSPILRSHQPKNTQDSINNVLQSLESNLATIRKERYNFESLRLFGSNKEKIRCGPSSPIDVLSKSILEYAEKMQKAYGQKENFIEDLLLNEKTVTGAKIVKTPYSWGKISHSWVFIEATDDDQYNLHIIVRFELEKDSTTSAGPSTTLHSVTIKPDPTEGGIATGQGEYFDETEVQLVAQPSDGYEFNSWKVADKVFSTERQIKFKVSNNLDLIASFERKKMLLVVGINNEAGGVVRGGGSYEKGTPVKLSIQLYPGFTFEGWYENSTSISSQEEFTYYVRDSNSIIEARCRIKPKPSAEITEVRYRANDFRNGEKGFLATAKVTVNNMANSNVKFIIHIYCSCEPSQKHLVGLYNEFTPPSDFYNLERSIFVKYEKFINQLETGTHELLWQLQLKTIDDILISETQLYLLTFTVD